MGKPSRATKAAFAVPNLSAVLARLHRLGLTGNRSGRCRKNSRSTTSWPIENRLSRPGCSAAHQDDTLGMAYAEVFNEILILLRSTPAILVTVARERSQGRSDFLSGCGHLAEAGGWDFTRIRSPSTLGRSPRKIPQSTRRAAHRGPAAQPPKQNLEEQALWPPFRDVDS